MLHMSEILTDTQFSTSPSPSLYSRSPTHQKILDTRINNLASHRSIAQFQGPELLLALTPRVQVAIDILIYFSSSFSNLSDYYVIDKHASFISHTTAERGKPTSRPAWVKRK